MNSFAIPRQRTLLTRLFAAAMISLLALFTIGTAAHAHDELIGSTPESGTTLTENPKEIVLNFSGELQTLADDGGTVVVISNQAGDEIGNDFEVKGRDVHITPATELVSGEYTVASRVISSDGHPIEKAISFTVESGENSAAPIESAAPETVSADESTAAPAEEPAQADETAATGGISPVLWIVIGVAIAGTAIAVLVNFTRRNNTR